MTEWWTDYYGHIPLSPKTKPKNLARGRNWAEFMNQFQLGFSTAMSLFEWDGLPDTVDPTMLERCFLLTGHAAIAEIDGILVALAADVGYDRNANGWPTKGHLYAYNGDNWDANYYVPHAGNNKLLLRGPIGSDIPGNPMAVLGWDNVNGYPMINYIATSALRISDTIRSCDVAVKRLKSPVIIVADQSEVKSINDFTRRIDDNDWLIITSKVLPMEGLNLVDNKMQPDTLAQLWQYKLNIEADRDQTLGIPNSPNQDKKERLISGEVDTNNAATALNIMKRLEWREKFADWCNDLWGLNMKPKINEEVMAVVAEDASGAGEDGSDDGAMRSDADSE